MAGYITNPYVQFVKPTLKEFIILLNNAITKFKSEKVFSLEPKSADSFCEHVKTLAKQDSYYGMIKRVPTECNIDATDLNLITYQKHKNSIDTWQDIDKEIIQKNSTQI